MKPQSGDNRAHAPVSFLERLTKVRSIRRGKLFFRSALTLTFLSLIVLLSVTPDQDQSSDSVFVWLVVSTATTLQKLLHILCYATLAYLCVWTLSFLQSPRARLITAVSVCSVVGTALELSQIYIPGRYATLADVLLNIVGALLGVFVASALTSRVRRE